MVYVTFAAAVQRPARRERWFIRPAVFTVAALVAGFAAGISLGALGGIVLTNSARTAFAITVGVGAILLGSLDLIGHPIRVPQRNRETPRRWLRWRASLAAARNGLALGTGWNTRIGFWLWFVVPLGSFISGSAVMGGVIYGVYGLTRGLGPWLLLGLHRIEQRVPSMERGDVGMWLLNRYGVMRTVTAVQLVSMGVIAIAAFTR